MNWDQLRSCFQPHECEGCLFVIEGDPGAGKTTAIRQLASQFDLVVFPEIDHASPNHKLHTAKVLGSSDWYLEAEAARQIELKALLKSGYCVLQDRSLLSTMAFTYASATSQSKAARVAHLLDRAALLPSFIAPDSLMILTVDVATSLQRRRAFIGHDAYKTWFDNQFLNRFQRFFLLAADARLAPKTHVIDTTFMSETQVVQTLAVELNCQLPTLKNSTS